MQKNVTKISQFTRKHRIECTLHTRQQTKQKTRRRTRNTQHTPEISERARIDSTPTKPNGIIPNGPEKQRQKNYSTKAERRNTISRLRWMFSQN